MREFVGRGSFTWFFGVVEDRNDPAQLGRVRVRAYGYHTDNKDKIPTAPTGELISHNKYF